MPKELITAEEARQLFSYNPETGDLAWRVSRSGVRRDRAAGYIRHDGYAIVFVSGRVYLAHRLIWAVVTGSWPNTGIDHINGSRNDNRWANLRLASKAENGRNRGAPSNNTSGFKGVSRNKKRWSASIHLDGRKQHLGTYDTPEQAHAAYCEAASEHYGEFANFG
jgi:hypothetical protein